MHVCEKMYRLDRRTHRYLIEPISEMEHLKSALVKRFLSFTEKLRNSPKVVVQNIYKILGSDCQTTTGANARRITLEYNTDLINGPSRNDITTFATTPEGEEWRSEMIKELIQVRDGEMNSIEWTTEELQETINHLCIS